jgi:transcriptional regulator with XRE-family HTH domain
MLFSGPRLRENRERVGLRREELAVRIHRSYISVVRFEQGSLRPSLATAASIAEVLGVPIDVLMDKQPAGAP